MPPGLSALGCQGSVRDRLTPPGRVECSALGRYIVPLRWRGTSPSAPFFIPPLAAKTIQPPCGRENAIPLWWLAPPPFPRKRWDYGCLAMEPCLCRKHKVIYSVPRMGWQGNTIRKGAKRPENRVTRFPVEKVRRSRIRGSRVAANHQNSYHAI